MGTRSRPTFWEQTFRQPMFEMPYAERSRSGKGQTEELTVDSDKMNDTKIPAHISWGQWTTPTATSAALTTPATTSTSDGPLASDTTPSRRNAISLAPARFKPTEISSGGKFQPIQDNVFCINHNVKYKKPKHNHDRKRKRMLLRAQREAEHQKSKEPESLKSHGLIPGTPPWERGALLPPFEAIKHLLCSGRYSTAEMVDSDKHYDTLDEVNCVRLDPNAHPASVTLSGSNKYSEVVTEGASCSGSIQYSQLHTHQTASGSIKNRESDSPSVSVTNSGHPHISKLFTDQTVHEGSGRYSEVITDKVTHSKSSPERSDPLGDTDSDSGIEEELEFLLRRSEDSSPTDDNDVIVDPNQETCSVKIIVEASVHYEPAREICDDSPAEIDVAEVFYLRSPEVTSGRQSLRTERTITVSVYSSMQSCGDLYA